MRYFSLHPSLPLSPLSSFSFFHRGLGGFCNYVWGAQKRGSLQWNKSLHNSCGEMALIADWFEAEAADICNAEPHLPHSPHQSPLWLSIVQAVYFVVMSGKWQVKEAKGARHQIGSLSKRRSVKLDIINTPLRQILQTSWRWQRCKLAIKIHTLYTKTVIKPPFVYRDHSPSWLRANHPLNNSFYFFRTSEFFCCIKHRAKKRKHLEVKSFAFVITEWEMLVVSTVCQLYITAVSLLESITVQSDIGCV